MHDPLDSLETLTEEAAGIQPWELDLMMPILTALDANPASGMSVDQIRESLRKHQEVTAAGYRHSVRAIREE